MALTERLAIVIDANGKGAIKEFNRVGNAAEKELGKTDDRTKKLGASLTHVGAVMIGVGAVLVGGALKAAKAFEEQQIAELRLQNTIEKMPMLAGASTDAFLKQASALQAITKYGDETTISAQAMLGTFNLTEDQILKLTPLVQDYASKFGTDLVEASKQVGKAVGGQIGALKRNGVTIDETAYKADRFTAVMDALRNQAGGFAAEEAKTFSGQVAIMKNNLGDMVEVIGGGAVGAFNNMLEPIKSVSGVLKDMPPAIGNVVGGFAAFGGVGLIVAGAASIAIGSIMRMKDNFVAAYESAKTFVTFMRTKMTADLAKSAAAFGLFAIAIVGVGIALNELSRKIGKDRFGDFAGDVDAVAQSLDELGRTGRFIGILKDIDALFSAKGDLDAYKDGLDSIQNNDWWKFGFGADWGAYGKGVSEGVQIAADNLKVLDEQLVVLYSTSVTKASDAFDVLKQRLLDAGWSMADIEKAFPGYIAAQNAGRDATGETNEATRLLTEALGEQADALNALFSPVFAAIDGQQKLKEAQQNARTAQLELNAAQAEYDRILGDAAATEEDKAAAGFKVLEAMGKLDQANYDVVKSAVAADGALLKLAEAEAKGETEAGRFKDQLNQWVAQGMITAEQAAIMAAKFDEVRAEAEGAAGTYDVNMTSNVDDYLGKFREAKQLLEAMPADKVNGAQRLIFGITPRALGGPVQARTPYLVGEQGPELFVPGANGRIIPSGKTKTLMAPAKQMADSNGSGGSTYNITINGLVGRDKQEILAFLARELPRAAATQARSYG
jgi:hypothetical protein